MVGSRRSRLGLGILTYAVSLSVTAAAVLPLVWTVLISVKPESEIVTQQFTYLPQSLTFRNYVEIWRQSSFPRLIMNSAISTGLTLLLCVSAGTLAAYAFSRYDFAGRKHLMMGYLSVRMFPTVLKLIPLFVMLRALGLLDSRFGLALAYTAFLLPIFVWMMKGFFDAVPRDLEDAARIDGCTRLSALWRVVLPVARTGLIATAVFVAIGAWNEFLFALMLTTSLGSRTWPVGLQLMVGEFQLPWGMLSAGGVITILPVLLLFGLVHRAMAQGLTAGATKG